ncbi:NADPH:quinone oxidoreductase family protein [Amycolatopsis acidicola]|uniref:NADPH:quinone oxidoreductase family protein n=1 Tax=Amycolatopsis acidicola TaxID=2596893 RepID=A0A5N0VJX5_9PSEU|nr:NADPH:quinone oxidoreductase family protein [Amycolatopsis acidicola]KAA9165988.1 NADPH:quinone oxidoreductase family protein [Amycolatopsis acidicola]
MKAMLLRELAGPQAIERAELPDPAGEGVLIEVRAAGICYPDLLVTHGRYQVQMQPPFVPGSEVSGVVLTAPDDSGFRPGERVSAMTNQGGYAERVLVPPAVVRKLPRSLDFADGAALLANHHTAHFALYRRAGLVAGETVLVLGAAGGVGSAAIQVAKALGARVLAGVRRSGHDEFLRGLGADEVTALGEGWRERVGELTGRGVDIVVDPVGGEVFDDAVRVLAPEGRLLVLGFAGGAIPRIKVNRLLLRNVSIVGAGWGEFLRTHPEALAETAGALETLVDKGLRPPVTRRYPLEQASRALADLEEGRIVGKAVLTV